ncbi:MAG: hypothetical protein QNJ74_18370 [Trichodesmium sp. MO_231.B1]|nr:hypothetical protein [Trichodesmium sp. MO_231.B1]
MYGSKLVIADRFYPSSQICSPYRASTENAIECETIRMCSLWF